MKYLGIFVVVVMSTAILTTNAKAAASASSLDSQCQKVASVAMKDGKWIKGNKESSEATFASGQCVGYIQGWLEATNGSVMHGGAKMYEVSIDIGHIDTWKVAEALHRHLAAVPLDGDKNADSVLLTILIDNKLLSTTEVLTSSKVASQEQ